jgi:predicted Fe-S protein YdhL (DUF1289 family)
MRILHTPSADLPLVFVRRCGPIAAASTKIDSPYIDFISAYCDHWCERCAFTERCYSFAWVAGKSSSPMSEHERREVIARFLEKTERDSRASASERAAFSARQRALDARVGASRIMRLGSAYRRRASVWLDSHRTRVGRSENPSLIDAFELVCWDAMLIGNHLHRALRGLDGARSSETNFREDPIQSDWNGSAKVALIWIARSAESWQIIDREFGADAHVFAGALNRLRHAVANTFPDAALFRRPGFDR